VSRGDKYIETSVFQIKTSPFSTVNYLVDIFLRKFWSVKINIWMISFVLSYLIVSAKDNRLMIMGLGVLGTIIWQV